MEQTNELPERVEIELLARKVLAAYPGFEPIAENAPLLDLVQHAFSVMRAAERIRASVVDPTTIPAEEKDALTEVLKEGHEAFLYKGDHAQTKRLAGLINGTLANQLREIMGGVRGILKKTLDQDIDSVEPVKVVRFAMVEMAAHIAALKLGNEEYEKRFNELHHILTVCLTGQQTELLSDEQHQELSRIVDADMDEMSEVNRIRQEVLAKDDAGDDTDLGKLAVATDNRRNLELQEIARGMRLEARRTLGFELTANVIKGGPVRIANVVTHAFAEEIERLRKKTGHAPRSKKKAHAR